VEHRGSLTGKRFGSIRFDKHRPNDPFVIDDRSHETAGLSLVNGERGITTEDISFSPVQRLRCWLDRRSAWIR